MAWKPSEECISKKRECHMLFLGPRKVKTELMVGFNNMEVISLERALAVEP